LSLYKFKTVSKHWFDWCTKIIKNRPNIYLTYNTKLLYDKHSSDLLNAWLYQVPNSKERRDFKFVVLGSGGVGKSTTTVQFTNRIFVEKYNPTIEHTYQITHDVGSHHEVSVMLKILDTGGSTEHFSPMSDFYIKNGDGFLLLFSVIAKSTFTDIPDYVETLRRVKGLDTSKIPLVIAGNKIDLVDSRDITSEEGVKLANSYGCVYLESSAKEYEKTKLLFEALICETLRKCKFQDSRSKKRENCLLQ